MVYDIYLIRIADQDSATAFSVIKLSADGASARVRFSDTPIAVQAAWMKALFDTDVQTVFGFTYDADLDDLITVHPKTEMLESGKCELGDAVAAEDWMQLQPVTIFGDTPPTSAKRYKQLQVADVLEQMKDVMEMVDRCVHAELTLDQKKGAFKSQLEGQRDYWVGKLANAQKALLAECDTEEQTTNSQLEDAALTQLTQVNAQLKTLSDSDPMVASGAVVVPPSVRMDLVEAATYLTAQKQLLAKMLTRFEQPLVLPNVSSAGSRHRLKKSAQSGASVTNQDDVAACVQADHAAGPRKAGQ